MSRTKGHDDKQPSEDLWSRRPCAGMIKSKFTRKLTVRKERNVNRQTLRNELRSNESD